jgi:hypothetical protein
MTKEKLTENESSLEELKKEYSILQKKYSLPSFQNLNEDFGIEKACEGEFDLLLREIRRYLWDKVASYMRLVENLINPVNVPIFIFSIVKSLNDRDKKALNEIYKKMGEIEIDLIEIDLIYSEEKEAKFIKECFDVWQVIKKDLVEIVGKVKSSSEEGPKNNDKNYFG